MESALYSLFQIDVRNLAKNRLFIAKEFKIQPSEIYKLDFFEYEWYLEDINEYQKEKQSQAEAQEKQHQQMQRQMKNPMGSMGNFKPPAMPTMPSFTMPKFG